MRAKHIPFLREQHDFRRNKMKKVNWRAQTILCRPSSVSSMSTETRLSYSIAFAKPLRSSQPCSSAFQFEEAERQPSIRTLSAQEVEPRLKLYGIIQSDSQQSLRLSQSFFLSLKSTRMLSTKNNSTIHDNHRMDFASFSSFFQMENCERAHTDLNTTAQ